MRDRQCIRVGLQIGVPAFHPTISPIFFCSPNGVCELIIESSNLGNNWQFNHQQMNTLKQYYDGNKLIVDCLNSDCYITRSVRDEIETTLLLPIPEIEQRAFDKKV